MTQKTIQTTCIVLLSMGLSIPLPPLATAHPGQPSVRDGRQAAIEDVEAVIKAANPPVLVTGALWEELQRDLSVTDESEAQALREVLQQYRSELAAVCARALSERDAEIRAARIAIMPELDPAADLSQLPRERQFEVRAARKRMEQGEDPFGGANRDSFEQWMTLQADAAVEIAAAEARARATLIEGAARIVEVDPQVLSSRITVRGYLLSPVGELVGDDDAAGARRALDMRAILTESRTRGNRCAPKMLR